MMQGYFIIYMVVVSEVFPETMGKELRKLKNILIIKKIRCHFIKLRFSYPEISNLGKLIYYSF